MVQIQSFTLNWPPRHCSYCESCCSNDSFFPYKRAERAKKNALRSAVRVADLLVDTVDGGVQELFVNEKRIELEARALLATIARYRKQTGQWLAATNAINSVLKVYSTQLPLVIFMLFFHYLCCDSGSHKHRTLTL